jgi:sialate O-acetylesterase
VAYFFGREISEREKVPVGLIDVTWGGTPAHSWISLDALAAANLTQVFQNGASIARQQGHADQVRARYAEVDADLQTEKKTLQSHPQISGDHKGAWAPGSLFNGMIAPDTNYIIKGVIWYQGETDSAPESAPNYYRVFPTLISDWRQQWHEGDFPFLFVQISSFGASVEGWPMVRDGQRRSLSLRNTGMAVSLDVGASENIHPPDKQTVGKRLALAALAIAYGEDVEYQSPEFLQTTTEPNAIRAWFANAKGLTTRGQALGGFEIAGADHKFVPATARIEIVEGIPTVVLTSPQISVPQFVRYGWSGIVTSFLYNSAGLPMGTFTSE